MPLSKGGYFFLAGTVIFVVAISLVSYSIAYTNALELSVRLLALNGFLALSIAAIMTPFLREIRNAFNKSFLNVHHSFAAVGLVLITLHPIVLSIQTLNPSVFLPSFSSVYSFFSAGGRQALIIIYIAVAFVLIRREIPKYWRFMHALIYIALFFGIVHANLLGVDFQNAAITVIYDALFTGVIIAFFLKRLQQYRLKRRIKQKLLSTQKLRTACIPHGEQPEPDPKRQCDMNKLAS
jgi:DMSO/TMAO reductase YedYZ heme-binding membrane subunit